MIVWTLKIGAITRTLTGWGIDAESLELNFRSFETDTLTWAMTEADVLAEPAFEYNAAVILYRNGVKWFVGRIHDDPVEFSAKGEVQKYVCKNAWADLETCIVKQEVAETSEDPTDVRTLQLTRLRLNWRVGVGKIPTQSQLEDVLDFAIADGVAIAYEVDFEGLTPPYQEARDVSVATVARMMGKWTPDLASHFDYTTEPYPTVIFRRRGNPITPVELALDEYLPATGLVSARPIRALRDLFLDGVEINFIGSDPNPDETGTPYTRLRQQVAGITTSLRRIARFTLPLSGRGTTDEEPEPEDFAANFYAIFQELFYEALLTFRHQDVPGTYRPGMVINFTGGRAAWTTAKAIVQRVTETPFYGETVVECGAPTFLNKGNFEELARIVSGVDSYGALAPAYIPSSGLAAYVDCVLACESKSGTATLCGFSEYTDLSEPRRKYRTETNAGTHSQICNGVPSEANNTQIKTYNADTCVLGTTGTAPVFCGTPDSVVTTRLTVTSSETYSGTGTGACCGSGFPESGTSNTVKTLSDEDSDDDAIARALPLISDWSSAPSGCINHTAYKTVRVGAEISFGFRYGRSQVSFTAIIGRSYRVRTFFKRRVYGSGSTFANYVSVDTTITASVVSTVMPYVETPNPDAGYEVLASSATAQLLPEA